MVTLMLFMPSLEQDGQGSSHHRNGLGIPFRVVSLVSPIPMPMARSLPMRCLPLLTALGLVICGQAQTFQLLTGWPQFNGVVHAMALDEQNGILYLGGDFTQADDLPRQRLAAIEISTGALTGWSPAADNTVRTIVVAGDSIVIGGTFTMVNGEARSRLASLDGAVGELLPWQPEVNGPVLAIVADGPVIRVGGNFSLADGSARLNAAAFEGETGVLDPWNPSVAGIVNSLSVSPEGVLAGGIFSSIGGASHSNAALVDRLTGTALPWTADTDAALNVIRSDAGVAYLGGSFTQVNSNPRAGISAITLADGLVDSWAPTFSGNVRAIGAAEEFVVAGGFFSSINGAPHGNLAVINRTSGTLVSSSPSASATVNTVLLHQGMLFVAGAFTAINGTSGRSRFAAFSYCFESAWYADVDEDGLGDNGAVLMACEAPAGYVADNSDCDDGDAGIGAATVWYRDLDEDENGDHTDSLIACTQPIGYVDNMDDCDDSDASVAMDNPCDDGDPYTTSDALLPWPECSCAGLNLALSTRVLLEGAYDPVSGLMRDDLRASGLIPLTEPYSALGYEAAPGSLPGIIDDPSVLDASGPDAVVDWVVLEIRDAVSGAAALSTRFVLVQRDGDIVEPDGVSPVRFPVAYGFYRLAVLHRNHMGVVTQAPSYLETTNVDFTSPVLDVYGGSDARRLLSGVMLLRSGDSTFNDEIKYVGESNDRDPVLVAIGGSIPTTVIQGYFTEDINMDGVVRYVGEGNDRDPVLTTIGGSNPNAVRANTYLRPTLP